MFQALRARWPLLLVLIIFIAFKLPALHYPFYLDESWSYAPGVKLMYLHGPSLMPNAIDLFYSRGHPMLFYAAAACWMKVFGTSFVAQHSFALFISCLLLAAMYEVCLRLYSKRAAMVSLLLMPLQVMFSVQSAMLLPEIMIALLSLLTLFFYVKDKYLYTFLCCTALIFTKESGMVMGAVLGINATLRAFDSTERLKKRLSRFLSVLCAGLLIGAFYLLQKQLNGWYLFPEHTGLISFSWPTFWKKFQYSLEVLFCHDNRLRLFQLLLLLGVIVAVHLKEKKYALPLIPAYLIYAVIEDRFSFLPRQVLFVVLLLSVLFTVFRMMNMAGYEKGTTRKFTSLGVYFFIAYISFACINFFTARYLTSALVIEMILLAIFILMYISRLYGTIYYLSLACIALSGYYAYKFDSGITDVDMGAYDAMMVQDDVVTYMEQQKLYDKNIFASFINTEHLQKPYTGFLHTDAIFKNVSYDINNNTQYLILDNIDSIPQYNTLRANPEWHQVYRTQKGQAWIEVYKK